MRPYSLSSVCKLISSSFSAFASLVAESAFTSEEPRGNVGTTRPNSFVGSLSLFLGVRGSPRRITGAFAERRGKSPMLAIAGGAGAQDAAQETAANEISSAI
mmetsp:Transcript_4193/g.9182  ORF Transcript_4193/g.9182 Transcript_4193/m.9182 type:complete len:102 (+) Transcript_4193:543-848(+)